MSVNQLKFNTLNQLRKDTQKQVSSTISQLNKLTSAAMKQQAYMHKNPDINGVEELIPIATPDFMATAAAFNEVAAKLGDMQALQSGTITIDDFITKYSINLTEFSAELI